MTKTQKSRRNKGKTDYKARLALLKSGKPRMVVRKSNRYITVQVVESTVAKDKVIMEASSRELLQKGWPKKKGGSLKSLQAAYLTGFLLGKKLKGKLSSTVLDAGMHRNVPGSRIYALLKGALDADIDVRHNKKILPPNERIKSNKELFEILEKIKENL